MRVVWITHNYPRRADDVAGAFLHPLAVALRELSVDVQVVAPSDAGAGGHDALDGVPVYRVRYGTASEEVLAYRGTMAGALRSPSALLALNRLRRALRDRAKQLAASGGAGAVVHAHWWVPGGLAAPPGLPLVLTCHGTDVRLLDRIPMATALARPVFRRARVVTTVSRSLADVIRRRVGVAVAEDAVQPMPVPALDRPWSDRSGDVVVLGRLTRQKRVDLALEAMALARARGLTRRLVVIGDGAARPMLEHRAAELGLGDGVTFAGEVSPAAVPGHLATAACCLMPAHDEGFGLAAAEALMQGVPVVACVDGGGLRDVVSAAASGRVVAADASALAGALLELIDQPRDDAAAGAIGASWRQRLSPGHVAGQCVTWYRRALDA